jgi:predicted transcriptional regulator
MEMEILLHCYYSPSPPPRIGVPAVYDAIKKMVKQGLVEDGGGPVYPCTSRGKAHVRQLCNLKYPTEAWVDSNGKVIEKEYPVAITVVHSTEA